VGIAYEVGIEASSLQLTKCACWVWKMTGRATVPHIFINGTSYGGCMDGPGLVPLYETGKLQQLLKKAGAL
jgi:glutaredoxin-related protein